MCINFRTNSDNRFSEEEELSLNKEIQKLIGDPAVQLVTQNGMFDSYWLWIKDRLKIEHIYFDTMLAHHTLYPTLPHNLGFLTSQYTNHPYYKDEGGNWKESTLVNAIDNFWRYNIKDCCITLAAQIRLEQELRAAGLSQFFFNHVMRLQPHLIRMTVMGVKIDEQLKNKISEELHEHVAKLRAEFIKLAQIATGDSELIINPNSPKQLADLFFRRLRLTGDGTKTDAGSRAQMLSHPNTSEYAKQMLNKLNEYKKEDKFLNTYAEMRLSPDGRIRCEYKQTGTQSAPGRLSSSKLMWDEGMNLQNQPERAYPMFIADTGYALGYFDLAQAEARVVAFEANISKWKEQFERARIDGSYDCHRALASEMWNIDYDDIPKNDRLDDGTPTLRFIAKRCRHGLNYRMGPERLADTTGLPAHEANKAYTLYHRTTPELRQWWDSVTREVQKDRMLFNCLGRRLIFLERLDDNALESIVAFKPQSTIGDKVCSVIYKSESDPEWPSYLTTTRFGIKKRYLLARIILNIHDALICLAPIDKIETCLRIMKKHAEEPLIIQGEKLIIPADTKMSQPDERGVHRWSNLKKVEVKL
jgi:DNA polymerase I-like protein with 3'-5' exonuclease and polymerase domains